MNPQLKRFTLKLIALTTTVTLVGTLLFLYPLRPYYINILPFLLLFVALTTFAVYFVVLRGFQKKSSQTFNAYFMGANGAKLLLFIFFFSIYLIVSQKQIVVFSVTFLSLYFIYTFFEVFELVRLVKQNS
jgi:hypothetical protein